MALITKRVDGARAGTNPMVLCRMKSGWAVMGDVQFLQGYCLLLPDPVVTSLLDAGEVVGIKSKKEFIAAVCGDS